METIHLLALALHVMGGNLALATGAFIMIANKGNSRHRYAGRWFYYSMLCVSLTSLLLSLIIESVFLLHIGIFVFYQNHAGYRSVHNKALIHTAVDWVVLMAALLNGLFMLASLQPVLSVFGALSLLLCTGDLFIMYRLKKNLAVKPLAWLSRHIGMMMGAYIGTITAFLVVNVKDGTGSNLYYWLGPTFLFVPLMQYWIWKYTAKGRRKEAVRS